MSSLAINKDEVQRFFPQHVAILNEVLDAVTAVPLQNTMDIRGTVIYDKDIIRVNTLSFFDGGILVLSKLNADFIAIAAQEIVIDNGAPNILSVITRPVGAAAYQSFQQMLKGGDGANGHAGSNGRNGDAGHHRGYDGTNGSDGASAEPGKTLTLPDIFIFTQQITLGGGTPAGTEVLTIYYDGVNGGDGGRGGNGGAGGNGGRGINASSGFGCHYSGGDGGNGGHGGVGGRGGNAANGGDGGWVYFYSPVENVLKFISVRQEGAPAGNFGAGGFSGHGGHWGDGGHGAGFCSGGRAGSSGVTPPPLGPGSAGVPGKRGLTDNEFRDNQDLWNPV